MELIELKDLKDLMMELRELVRRLQTCSPGRNTKSTTVSWHSLSPLWYTYNNGSQLVE